MVIFSDRATLSKPTNDFFAVANVIHELICGMRINKLDSGKYLIHHRVKNSKHFRDIQALIKKSEQPYTVSEVLEERAKAKE